MSSAVLADKHVDSFGPELLIKAWRGTDCSCPHPAAPCFSSSLPWGGQGTGLSDPPLPELSRWGEGKKVGLPFRSLSLAFCSLTYSLCCSSPAQTAVAMAWGHFL